MQDFFLYWQRVFLHYFIDICKVWVLLAPLVIFYKEIQYEAHCFTAFLLHVQMLNSNVKYSWFALIVKISKKLQSCGVEEQVPEPFVTQKDSHQAKPSFWPGQQLECTVKIPYVHTHTHPCTAILYGVWKAITLWQKAYGTVRIAAHVHLSVDNESTSQQRTSRNIFQTADWNKICAMS